MQAKTKIIRYSVWTLAGLALLAIVARILLAPITEWAIGDYFAQQGIESRVGDISFDLGDGRFRLQQLVAEAGGKPVLELERLELRWSWQALSDRRLELDAVSVDGLSFDVERSADGKLVVAGIDLSAPAEDDSETGDTGAQAEPLEWTLSLQVLEVANTNVCYRQPPGVDLCNRLDDLDWQGQLEFDLAELDAEALPLRADGEFRLAGFESRSNALQRVLASFDKFAFEDIAVDTGNDIGIGAITLETLNLFERDESDRADSSDGEFIEHVDRLHVNEIRLQGNNLLTADEILVEGNATDFVKAEANRYELDAWLAALGQVRAPADEASAESSANDTPADGAAAETRLSARDAVPEIEPEPPAPETESGPAQAVTAAESQAAGSFDFVLGKLVFETEKPLRYRDLSLGKPFTVGLSSTRLVVEGVDSRQPDQPSNITYEAKLGGDSLFEIAGTATPLAPKPSFDLSGEIRALDLRQLSPFTAASIGHTIKSGQLDADIKLQAEQAIANGKIDLILYHFNLEALSDADAEAMEARFGFPLETSLSLLKNRDGNIELEVPLSGDLENPDFGTGKIITRELSKAITSAVLTFYTPFGLVTAADALFSLATALEFEPVTFAAGTSELDTSRHGDLDKIASLMQERPGVQLRLCPHTNTADREALLPDTAGLSAGDIDPGDMPALGELGEARILAVEQYLAGKEIDPARLVPCALTHEEGEGLAGIEITI